MKALVAGSLTDISRRSLHVAWRRPEKMKTPLERRPSLPACFLQVLTDRGKQAGMGGAPRKSSAGESIKSISSKLSWTTLALLVVIFLLAD
jgi:hypothetical protein